MIRNGVRPCLAPRLKKFPFLHTESPLTDDPTDGLPVMGDPLLSNAADSSHLTRFKGLSLGDKHQRFVRKHIVRSNSTLFCLAFPPRTQLTEKLLLGIIKILVLEYFPTGKTFGSLYPHKNFLLTMKQILGPLTHREHIVLLGIEVDIMP